MALIVDGTGKRDNRLVTNEFAVTNYTEDLALAGNEAGADTTSYNISVGANGSVFYLTKIVRSA